MLRVKTVLFFCFTLASVVAHSQPCGGVNPPCDPGAPVPIPGLAIIFLSGLVLGIFKLVKKKNQ
jgi:hypothetical protein